MPAPPTVAIIILNWNNPRDTLACLDSVSHLTYQPMRVIVVDNGSTDGSASTIASCYPQVEIVRSKENLGYAGGNNLGMRAALSQGCDYFWLLNDDILAAPESLSLLVSAAQAQPAAGMLGPMVYIRGEQNRILSAGGLIEKEGIPSQRGMGELDDGRYNGVTEVDYVSGCALLISRYAVDRIGMLDEDFFAYHEEIEWCYRARQTGMKVLFVPKALAWHPDTRLRDYDSPVVTYYITRNSLLFARKHHLGKALIARMFFGSALTLVRWSVQPRWWHKVRQRRAMARGLADFMLGRYGRAEAL